ncbi:glycosyltransferase family 15 protein [Lipomyces tetrasporus]|uniref:Glycosyltransferase family 15 protein n=1 Tax=Lipomyces tetrasporus TaxID=54092 RepID=A0AAD7QZE0_9ASCO|nr:glycosyltransferase family 15 protein [Lipomyces tetrasporus]KAJ8104269.1 glycosyltransferase family 15 protein [Lipomyces tetrasporus]
MLDKSSSVLSFRPPRLYTRTVQYAVVTFLGLLLLVTAINRHSTPKISAPSYAALNEAVFQAHSQKAFTPLVPKSDANVPVEVLRARRKPKAALISLVRNSELEGIEQSMRHLEARFNHKYNYPWIFFNDVPFDDTFKARTGNLTNAECFYATVPESHWSLPKWIDESRFISSLEYLGAIGVGKGWMISYRHMCRWNSGFFYQHPILDDFDWYWRVEPDVHFFCDIDYDPFAFMEENNLKYGFNMNILDDARSFPSMWRQTQEFMSEYPELIHPEADFSWVLDHKNDGEYNNCQFFSNFEIGSLDFFRSKTYNTYFDYIDRKGGFYYERFGDAPLHTLAVVLLLSKRETHFFRDIGYQHDINKQCPANLIDKCSCEPTNLDENFYKLVPMESPQKKPDDSCIRLWLGGEWLERDGNGNYVKTGFEF